MTDKTTQADECLSHLTQELDTPEFNDEFLTVR